MAEFRDYLAICKGDDGTTSSHLLDSMERTLKRLDDRIESNFDVCHRNLHTLYDAQGSHLDQLQGSVSRLRKHVSNHVEMKDRFVELVQSYQKMGKEHASELKSENDSLRISMEESISSIALLRGEMTEQQNGIEEKFKSWGDKVTALLEDLEKVKAKQSEIEKNIDERNSNLANLYSAAEFVTPIKQYC